ncbi:HIT family protein [Alteribacter aurantiacus]|uniref:HIT family protein n=1 Tax=Alteribacter aurantiacus TaxID=254410 RepID=UPI00047E2FE2|nr:HIT family protein [Alteribacter aurantiacus]
MTNSDCLGCRLAKKIAPVHLIYENEHVSCILDHDPYNEGHTLILPKRHASELTEFSDETQLAIMNASILLSKALNSTLTPDGITVYQSGGVFNELTHVHVHIVPRYEGEDFADFFKEGPISSYEKLDRTASCLKETIKSLLLNT